VAYPQSSFSSQHAEEQFEFFDGDTVAGQNSKHIHQQVCLSWREKKTKQKDKNNVALYY